MARYRPALAAVCAAVALAAALHALAPPEPPSQPVLIAAHDLRAGEAIDAGDVRTAAWPEGTAPEGRVTDVEGRVLASPLRAGEPVTDARLAGPGLLTGQPHGTVAVPVRLADPASTALVRAGDRVDVLAGGAIDHMGEASSQDAQVVASRALVLMSAGAAGAADSMWGPDPGSGFGGALGGVTGSSQGGDGVAGAGVLVLAVDHVTAARLATAAGRRALSIAVRGSA